ncbi:MAG TPA: SIMPL domain-containing protein [Bryobacteraceae bacterium]|jgi:hypothetical protein
MTSRATLFLALLLPCTIVAQEASNPHVVRASGEATVTAKPDRAQISIGVVNDARTAEEASAQNARQSSTVLNSIKGALAGHGEVTTTGYSISPQYDYSPGHAPRLTGYQARNTVSVTVNDLSITGKVIDAATTVGANNIEGVSFSLRDDAAVRARALAEAAQKARANGEAIAKALSLRVVAVLRADTEQAPIIRPVQAMQFAGLAKAERAPTPIEPGTLDIHATVIVTLQVE